MFRPVLYDPVNLIVRRSIPYAWKLIHQVLFLVSSDSFSDSVHFGSVGIRPNLKGSRLIVPLRDSVNHVQESEASENRESRSRHKHFYQLGYFSDSHMDLEDQ